MTQRELAKMRAASTMARNQRAGAALTAPPRQQEGKS